jgi:hypothetical protein
MAFADANNLTISKSLISLMPISTEQAHGITIRMEIGPSSGPEALESADIARCFLRLANLATYPLDRLSCYEATLWRQVGTPFEKLVQSF